MNDDQTIAERARLLVEAEKYAEKVGTMSPAEILKEYADKAAKVCGWPEWAYGGTRERLQGGSGIRIRVQVLHIDGVWEFSYYLSDHEALCLWREYCREWLVGRRYRIDQQWGGRTRVERADQYGSLVVATDSYDAVLIGAVQTVEKEHALELLEPLNSTVDMIEYQAEKDALVRHAFKRAEKTETEIGQLKKIIHDASFDRHEAGGGCLRYGVYNSAGLKKDAEFVPPDSLPNIPELEDEIKRLRKALVEVEQGGIAEHQRANGLEKELAEAKELCRIRGRIRLT